MRTYMTLKGLRTTIICRYPLSAWTGIRIIQFGHIWRNQKKTWFVSSESIYRWIVHPKYAHCPPLNLISILAQKCTTPPLLGYLRIKGKNSCAHHLEGVCSPWVMIIMWNNVDNDQTVLYFFIRQWYTTGQLKCQSVKADNYIVNCLIRYHNIVS